MPTRKKTAPKKTAPKKTTARKAPKPSPKASEPPHEEDQKVYETPMHQDAMDYMGWEGDNMGELYTPTRQDMIEHLVEFATPYLDANSAPSQANSSKPSQLDRIEATISKVHEELLSVRSIAHHARTAARVNTGKLDLLLSGATFMQELDKNTWQLQDMKEIGEKCDAEEAQGLQPGDYTDASKEVADALTAMGWEWWDNDLEPRGFVMLSKRKNMAHVDACEGDVVYLTPAEFLLRAAVTAKEIGLVPKVPKVEKWVPKVGDWVVWNANFACVTEPPIGPHQVTEVNDMEMRINRAYQVCDGMYRIKDFRPATEQEIAAHLAEQEAKKPVEFGTRVEYQDDKGWRVACNEADKHGWWMLVKPSTRSVCSAKRHEFTVIEQP